MVQKSAMSSKCPPNDIMASVNGDVFIPISAGGSPEVDNVNYH